MFLKLVIISNERKLTPYIFCFQIPNLMWHLQKSNADWNYNTEPGSTGGLGTPNGIFWPRGKILGGTSSLNGILNVRGNRRDYDNWAAMGNEGWNWNTVLEYFKKPEDNRIVEAANDTKKPRNRWLP